MLSLGVLLFFRGLAHRDAHPEVALLLVVVARLAVDLVDGGVGCSFGCSLGCSCARAAMADTRASAATRVSTPLRRCMRTSCGNLPGVSLPQLRPKRKPGGPQPPPGLAAPAATTCRSTRCGW